MATIKSYTDIPQSKKLAEILPFESADMVYIKHSTSNDSDWRFDDNIPPMILGKTSIKDMTVGVLPCWSLAALLSVLPIVHLCVPTLKMKLNRKYYMELCIDGANYKYISTNDYNNPVDACVAMIDKLHELKML